MSFQTKEDTVIELMGFTDRQSNNQIFTTDQDTIFCEKGMNCVTRKISC